MSTPATPLLDIRNLDAYYGNIQALRNVSLHVHRGELVCLIGANGAGKSTLLKSIAGLLPVRRGDILFQSGSTMISLSQMRTHERVSYGLALVPEGRGIFPHMTAEENLLMGACHRRDDDGIRRDIDHAYSLFPRLGERRSQLAGNLSGGEQQMMVIARALLSKPVLLLLDEPSMGLAPLLVQKIFEVINAIHREGTSILLVEQNANVALAMAQRAYVMEHGEITLHGSAQELLHNPAVKSAYLGG